MALLLALFDELRILVLAAGSGSGSAKTSLIHKTASASTASPLLLKIIRPVSIQAVEEKPTRKVHVRPRIVEAPTGGYQCAVM
ncbi:hypothetical protein BU26DRAFT_517635 [Trematosphaeria pertusa]|uniref:Secreted protein n=1 Tax=Trematosphaeria pertusa TaxID=390896 RepID=A0A6A6IKA2_9PLEO|nr:uncharacterized protein BU26DRAFT_517635 [Trematosphaeria pertusa]KAF2250861.1 hypothetical protein BU26DRAFT_517635 [Trematosphaeria pertusa]